MRRYWLIKTEADCYSIDDLKRDIKSPWSGVRNYQARNFMRDDMSIGDLALFYHSSSNPTGACGIAEVCSLPYGDSTALDKKNEHFDKKSYDKYMKSKKDFEPIWILVDFKFVKKFKRIITLAELKNDPKLEGMLVRQTGSRLSIQPVSKEHFEYITKVLTKG